MALGFDISDLNEDGCQWLVVLWTLDPWPGAEVAYNIHSHVAHKLARHVTLLEKRLETRVLIVGSLARNFRSSESEDWLASARIRVCDYCSARCQDYLDRELHCAVLHYSAGRCKS